MRAETQYINHTLNTSKSRNITRFGKAPRFQSKPQTPTDFNYNVSSRRSSRSCSFGIGNRPDLTHHQAGPDPDAYNLDHFPSDRRGTSLGESRQNAVFRSMINEIEKKAQLPSPDTYNLDEHPNQKGFTLRMKLPGEIEYAIKKRVPGPGEYKPLEMNKLGKYATSKIRNIRCISFGAPRKQYFSRSSALGPGAYDIFNMDSSFGDHKIKYLRRNTAKTFGSSDRRPVDDRSKVSIPGPGRYEIFSSFGEVLTPRVR